MSPEKKQSATTQQNKLEDDTNAKKETAHDGSLMCWQGCVPEVEGSVIVRLRRPTCERDEGMWAGR